MKYKQRFLIASLVLVAAVLLPVAVVRSAQQAPPAADRLTKQQVQIAMRDGVKLNTLIYSPKDRKGPLPVMMLRTPYGIDRAGERAIRSSLSDLDKDGYIFVFQDIRGRFQSE